MRLLRQRHDHGRGGAAGPESRRRARPTSSRRSTAICVVVARTRASCARSSAPRGQRMSVTQRGLAPRVPGRLRRARRQLQPDGSRARPDDRSPPAPTPAPRHGGSDRGGEQQPCPARSRRQQSASRQHRPKPGRFLAGSRPGRQSHDLQRACRAGDGHAHGAGADRRRRAVRAVRQHHAWSRAIPRGRPTRAIPPAARPIQVGGVNVRKAAAEARQALLEMASARFGVPQTNLTS